MHTSTRQIPASAKEMQLDLRQFAKEILIQASPLHAMFLIIISNDYHLHLKTLGILQTEHLIDKNLLIFILSDSLKTNIIWYI